MFAVASVMRFNVAVGPSRKRFLGHATDEAHYFLLLIQHERAGTPSLRRYFSEQIEQVHLKRLVLKERVGVSKTLGVKALQASVACR